MDRWLPNSLFPFVHKLSRVLGKFRTPSRRSPPERRGEVEVSGLGVALASLSMLTLKSIPPEERSVNAIGLGRLGYSMHNVLLGKMAARVPETSHSFPIPSPYPKQSE